ncbi:MAG: hypothetical protein HYR86_07925, partial [Candidatus Rokubacteria bacterium]|nr:hypothetical protein [Candidatus Rokubacteria bacterium]
MTASRGVARFHAYAASVLLPLVTGTVPSRWTGYYLLIALVAMALALPARRAPWSGRLALGLAALAVSAAAADTAARPFTARWLYARPDEAFVRHWPPLPIVPRFESNVDVETEVSGDLARGPRFAAAREPRRVRFTTDAAGFPNEPGVLGAAPDLILLGDSF